MRIRTTLRRSALPLAILAAAACDPGGDPGTGAGAAVEPSPAAAESIPAGETVAAGGDTPAGVALPGLFTIMAGLERDMAGVSRGLWRGSADSVAFHARAVADHPAIPAAEGERIAGALGSGMARFRELDREVHDLAVRLAEHAAQGEVEALQPIDAELRRGCVTCHLEFRDRLRQALR